MSPSSSGHVNMMKGQPFHVKYREIIRRMMFLIGALLVFRLGAHIPVPGINNAALENLFNANQGTILGLFNMFSGGALERMSILALGIMPYISASIIVQLMSTVIPSLEALKKEGEQGKRKINQYATGYIVPCTRAGNWDVCWSDQSRDYLNCRSGFLRTSCNLFGCRYNVLDVVR